MDDPLSTPNDSVFVTDEPMSLDATMAELKAEFARLEQVTLEADREAVRRAKAALDLLDELDPTPRSAQRKITCAIERAMLALNALGEVEGLAFADFFAHQTRYWSAVFKYFVSALAKLNSLLARFQRALFRVPLFADGPELSGYKHRLR
ncbi:hypothetical protein [Pseudomonas umsongensis]